MAKELLITSIIFVMVIAGFAGCSQKNKEQPDIPVVEFEEEMPVQTKADIPENMALYFGNSQENLGLDSLPLFMVDLSLGRQEATRLFADEEIIDTEEKISIDSKRKRIIYIEAKDPSRLKKYNLDSGEEKYFIQTNIFDSVYQASLWEDTMAATGKKDNKDIIWKFNLNNNSREEIEAFASYESCTYPTVSQKQEIFAVCRSGGNYYIVDEEGKIYYKSNRLISSLLVNSDNGFFIEENEIVGDAIKRIELKSKKIYAIAVNLEGKPQSISVNPTEKYLAAKTASSDKEIIYLLNLETDELSIIAEGRSLGDPQFGPEIDIK